MSKITSGEKYDAVQLNYQGEDGMELMKGLSPEKNSFVLDLGCGTGYLASVLADRVGPNGKVYIWSRPECRKNESTEVQNTRHISFYTYTSLSVLRMLE